MPSNILDIENKDVMDLLTDNDLKAFIKNYYQIDHIYYKKDDILQTIIIE